MRSIKILLLVAAFAGTGGAFAQTTASPPDAKPADAKPAETKPADAKGQAKAPDAKPADAKSTDAKSTDAKPADAKSADKPKFTKAQIEAFLSKCSDEADAKGLSVSKGKAEARKAFRRECMHKFGVDPR